MTLRKGVGAAALHLATARAWRGENPALWNILGDEACRSADRQAPRKKRSMLLLAQWRTGSGLAHPLTPCSYYGSEPGGRTRISTSGTVPEYAWRWTWSLRDARVAIGLAFSEQRSSGQQGLRPRIEDQSRVFSADLRSPYREPADFHDSRVPGWAGSGSLAGFPVWTPNGRRHPGFRSLAQERDRVSRPHRFPRERGWKQSAGRDSERGTSRQPGSQRGPATQPHWNRWATPWRCRTTRRPATRPSGRDHLPGFRRSRPGRGSP